jgi:hypothetical protein
VPASKNSRLGNYETTSVAGERVRAFVPPPLPPVPPLELNAERHDLLEKANRSLGRLDGVATLFPDPALFLYMYVRKEALLSSQIEGTQSSFSDPCSCSRAPNFPASRSTTSRKCPATFQQ